MTTLLLTCSHTIQVGHGWTASSLFKCRRCGKLARVVLERFDEPSPADVARTDPPTNDARSTTPSTQQPLPSPATIDMDRAIDTPPIAQSITLASCPPPPPSSPGPSIIGNHPAI